MRFILAFSLVCTFSFPSGAQKNFHAPHLTAKRVTNGPYPSCTKPLFQSEAKYEAIDVKMVFYSDADKTYFHKKGFALSLVLKVKDLGNWLGYALFIRGISEQSMILSFTFLSF